MPVGKKLYRTGIRIGEKQQTIMMTGAINYPYTIHNVRLDNGCNIAYVDEGKGKQTLVFVHGLATYALSWKKNIEGLKDRYRCIAIDLPGNGFSDRGDYSYSLSFFASTIIAFIGKLGLQHVTLVGHSMGGQIAISAVLQEPACAEKLVLCAPAGFETFTPVEKDIYQRALQFFDLFSTEENSLRKAIQSSFYHSPNQGDDMVHDLTGIMQAYPIHVYRSMIDACIAGMLNEPVFDRLHLIQQPTMVLYGERDALIPNKLLHPVSTRKIGETGVAQMQDAVLHMIPQCGHFLQWEKADVTNAYIREFVG